LKKILTIFLLSAYLLSATELYQLIKLPFLVSHFVAHKKENPTISLWSFICIHYANGEVFDSDHEDDMKLPFKTHEAASHTNFVAQVPVLPGTLDKPVCSQNPVFKLDNESFTESRFPSGIWQPPKFF